MNVVFERYSDELPTRSTNNTNSRGNLICIKMLPINTSLHKCLNFNSFSKISMLILEIKSPKNFGLTFDKEKYLIKHIPLINNDLFFGKLRKLGNWWYNTNHKIWFILIYHDILLQSMDDLWRICSNARYFYASPRFRWIFTFLLLLSSCFDLLQSVYLSAHHI